MTVSSQQFIERLTGAGILGGDLGRRLAERSGGRDSSAIAKELVEYGVATRFQCDSLLADSPRAIALGDYLLVDKLGAGGMGVVFRAKHKRMDRMVALKVLSRDLVGSPEAVQRFYREVKAIARLHHPNIVLAYDASECDGEHFLVMEHVEGHDLRSLVDTGGPLPIGLALGYLLQAAEGLSCAHEHGIIHRDVKPGNILVTNDGQVKVLDLGLARLREDEGSGAERSLTQTGLLLGTVTYMAPEHAENPRAADERSDVYSLGCTLYRALSGMVPYDAETTIQVVLAARERPIPDVRKLYPASANATGWLDGLQSVFARMLAKRPEDRFDTMAKVVEALRALKARAPAAVLAMRAVRPGDENAARMAPRLLASGDAATRSEASPLPAMNRGSSGAGLTGSGGREALTRQDTSSPSGAADARRQAPTRTGGVSTPGARATWPRATSAPSGAASSAPHVAARGVHVPAPTRAGQRGSGLGSETSRGTAAMQAPARPPWLAIGLGAAAIAIVAVVVTVLLVRGSNTSDSSQAGRSQPALSPAPPATPAAAEAPISRPPVGPARVGHGIAPIDPDEDGTDLLAVLPASISGSPLGKWTKTDGILSSDAAPASLVVPLLPPPGYRTLLRFELGDVPAGAAHADAPVASTEPLTAQVGGALRLVAGDAGGGVLVLDLDSPAGGGFSTTLDLTDRSARSRKRLASHSGRLLDPGRSHVVEIHAHPEEIYVFLDNRAIFQERRPPVAFDPQGERVGRVPLGVVSAGPLKVFEWSVTAFAPPPMSKPGASRRSPPGAGSPDDAGAGTGGGPPGGMPTGGPPGYGGQGGGPAPPPPPYDAGERPPPPDNSGRPGRPPG